MTNENSKNNVKHSLLLTKLESIKNERMVKFSSWWGSVWWATSIWGLKGVSPHERLLRQSMIRFLYKSYPELRDYENDLSSSSKEEALNAAFKLIGWGKTLNVMFLNSFRDYWNITTPEDKGKDKKEDKGKDKKEDKEKGGEDKFDMEKSKPSKEDKGLDPHTKI